MPNPATFWNLIAKWYARQPVADEAAYQRKLEMTRARVTPETEIFEFGCGTGSTAIAHAPYVKHVDAIDISPRMIAIAREKAEKAGVRNVAFEVGGIDGVDPSRRSYDAVLALSILHLVADRDAVLAKVHDMLPPGGLFVSSTTCMGESLSFFRYIGPVGYRLGILPLLRIFTRGELEKSIRDAGFEIEEAWQPGANAAVFIIARRDAG